MLRDITLGQYFPGKSWIHKLDPRIKIIATLLFIIELFIVDNFIGFLIAGIVLGILIAASKVPCKLHNEGTQAHTADSDIHLCAEHVHGGRKNTVAMEVSQDYGRGS